MTGVLVIGASGYVGRAVAEAARRDGYTVYGVTRSDAKAARLRADEIRPIVCDPKDADALETAVARCEFVIDCTADYAEPDAVPNACLSAIRACCAAGGGGGGGASSKRHYIYTSGGLVHGDHEGRHVHEDDVVADHAAWRLELESRLLAVDDVDCTVIRPAFVYGKSGGFFANTLFGPPAEGEALRIAGKPDKRWSWVHVDDLAAAYLAVMHRRSAAAGRVYDIGEPFGPTYQELRLACAKLAGFDGEIEYIPAEEFDAFMDITFLFDAKRARDELGWVPRHTGIMAELPLFYDSYKACKAGT